MPPSNAAVAQAFASLIAGLGCRPTPGPRRLRSMTLRVGAGSSKAWEICVADRRRAVHPGTVGAGGHHHPHWPYGGFEVVSSGNGYELDYDHRSTEALVAAPPVTMLPPREQDCSDPDFRSVFPKAVRLMRE